MGWTSYHANYYKNGTVDRKAECDSYFMEGLNRDHFEVLKSVMVGSVYYAAVKSLKKFTGTIDGKRVYEPATNTPVWAAVFITSTNMRDSYNFSYKDMDETVGPCQCDCPESILKLLDPTDSAYATDWRKRCRDRAQYKKKIKKLPIGTQIKFKAKFDMSSGVKAGQDVLLQKGSRYKRGKQKEAWNDGHYYWKESCIPAEYEVVS